MRYMVTFFLYLIPSMLFAENTNEIWTGKVNFWDKTPISHLTSIVGADQIVSDPFLLNADSLYYTKVIKRKGRVQSDVFLYTLSTNTQHNVTLSDQNEYLPKGNLTSGTISFAKKVPKDGSTELVQSIDDKSIKASFPKSSSIRNYAWINNDALLLVTSRDLNLVKLPRTAESKTITSVIESGVGESLHRFRNTEWYLYTKGEAGRQLKAFNVNTKQVAFVTDMPLGSRYFSVSPTGHIVTTDGQLLWYRKIIKKGMFPHTMDGWKSFDVSAPTCHSKMTRVTFSDFGGHIALLCPSA